MNEWYVKENGRDRQISGSVLEDDSSKRESDSKLGLDPDQLARVYIKWSPEAKLKFILTQRQGD